MTDITDRAAGPDLERRWAAIEERLAAVADRLVRQGTMARKVTPAGREVWVIRYLDEVGGARVQKSVYVGDSPDLVDRARRLLGRYREREHWPEEIAAYARLALATKTTARRLTPPGRAFRPQGGTDDRVEAPGKGKPSFG
jgi:hypothetical protein